MDRVLAIGNPLHCDCPKRGAACNRLPITEAMARKSNRKQGKHRQTVPTRNTFAVKPAPPGTSHIHFRPLVRGLHLSSVVHSPHPSKTLAVNLCFPCCTFLFSYLDAPTCPEGPKPLSLPVPFDTF